MSEQVDRVDRSLDVLARLLAPQLGTYSRHARLTPPTYARTRWAVSALTASFFRPYSSFIHSYPLPSLPSLSPFLGPGPGEREGEGEGQGEGEREREGGEGEGKGEGWRSGWG